ncbi:acyl-CoA thioesterase [Amycolatopsis sp. cmx-11-51]|uniref:acyl-CoA thioesterase n=1 Tax=unclassified Amycolatopsis TaxID=2618356 RepID=UPI0039E2D217
MALSKPFELEKLVTLQDTNAVGNVYFASYILWQGECRERCLAEHVPSLQQDLSTGLALMTASCSCEYMDDLRPLDRVVVRMFFGPMRFHTSELVFEYHRRIEGGEKLVAKGRQTVALVRYRDESGGGVEPAPWPRSLLPFAAKFGIDIRRATVALG